MSSELHSPQRVLHAELKVLAMVAGVLLLVELVLQYCEPALSIDIRHLRAFAAITAELRPAEAHPRHSPLSAGSAITLTSAAVAADPVPPAVSPLQILFLGNSTTRHGLDRTAFQQSFWAAFGGEPHLLALHPDNSRISEWSYAYRNFVAERQRAPQVLVIAFVKEQLRDAPSKTPERIARFYGCSWDDLPRLAAEDVRGVEGWADFLLARYSATYANRERVERRILGRLIPHYEATSNLINDRTQPAAFAGQQAPATYRRLAELTELARQQAVPVILVAWPTRDSYELEPSLLSWCEQHQVPLIDCRQLPDITPEMIPDGLHLDAAGAEICSRFLGNVMPKLLGVEHGFPPGSASPITPAIAGEAEIDRAVR